VYTAAWRLVEGPRVCPRLRQIGRVLPCNAVCSEAIVKGGDSGVTVPTMMGELFSMSSCSNAR
jgi:hypothetical protein